MSTKLDARQIISRDLLDQIVTATGVELDNILRSISSNETPPLKLSATGTNRVVSVGSIFVTNPETSKNRTIPSISNALPNFTSGTITAPATGAGTITVSPGTNLVIAMTANQFLKVGINLDALGNMSLTTGTAAASLAAATVAPGIKNTFGIGYIVLRTDGSNNVANILTSDIYQYVGGGGSGSGGDANSFLETIKANLREGAWQLATPNIFSSVGSTQMDGSSTASYSLVSQTVQYSSAGQFMLSTQSLDANEFLTAERDVASIQLMAQWATGYIDTAATYQVSRDGGANFQTVAMSRIGTTDTFVGTKVFTAEPSSASLAAQATYTTETDFHTNLGTGFNGITFSSAIQSDGKILIVGGFTTLDGVTRNRLVRLNSNGTVDTSFYTNLGTSFGATATSIALQSDGKILVGGVFTTFNGNTRNGLVRLNSDGTEDAAFYTNLGTGFTPAAQIRRIVIQTDGKILVGGDFTTLNGITRNRLVRLNSDGTHDAAFYTNLGSGFGGNTEAIALQTDGKILVGGGFNTLNGITRNCLVRLNSDGTHDAAFYTNLGSGFDLWVYAITIQSDGKILVGGAFSALNGITRNALVRLNADGTVDAAFYTNLGTGFNDYVRAITIQTDGKILAGGNFTTLNGVTRNRLVRLNSNGTHDAAFYTNLGTSFGATIRLIIINSNEKIFAGGDFTTLNGITRNRLAKLNATGTVGDSFYASLGTGFDHIVATLSMQSDGKMLAGGLYNTLNGATKGKLIRLNSGGTENTAFTTNLGTGFDFNVYASAVQTDGKILVGGNFTTLNGITRNKLVRLNADGTVDTSFYTNLGTSFDADIMAITVQTDGKILVGGSFTALNGITRNGLVRLNSDGTHDAAFYTNLGTGFNSAIRRILVQSDGKILVGGDYTTLNGITRNGLVRLNSDGTHDAAFYTNLGTGFSSGPWTLALQTDGKILAGGSFTILNGVTRNRLVRLNSDGTVDAAFYTNLGTGFNALIRCIVVQTDGKILVGGGFTTLNGITRNCLVRLNSDGTHDAAFYTNLGTGFNLDVHALAIRSDSKIAVGGEFTALNGTTRNNLLLLNSDGTQDTNANATVATTTLNTTSQQRIAQSFTLSNAAVSTSIDLDLVSSGTPLGNLYIQIVRDAAGLPSTLLSDLMSESSPISASSIITGVNTISLPSTVMKAGTYHVVMRTDAAYAAQYTATSGASKIEMTISTTADGTTTYNGTTWSDPGTTGIKYALYGRILDLRVKITSSAADVKLAGTGILYDIQTNGIVGGIKNRQVFKFNSTTNPNTFALTRFRPDPDLLSVYLVETGQVFRAPAFTLNGNTVTFPANSFNNGGIPADLTLVFDQTNGTSFDNSDMNALLLASNFLGSTDATIDRSVAGRGIFLRRPDGTLRELTIDNSDTVTIYSV